VRNAAQLRAALREIGVYDAYRGDGASVPWLEAGLVAIGWVGLLATYKVYLDLRWPEAFKLHDCLYTPYGTQINATREEADSALYEEIVRDSPGDAWLIYLAVRTGGGIYFGKSMTGYSGPQVGGGRSNMFIAFIDP